MTIRGMGGAAIKLLGVYYAAVACRGAGDVVGFVYGPNPQAVQFLYVRSVGSLLGVATAAIACLVGGDAIARRLLPDETMPMSHLRAKGVLWAGICLIGIGVGVTGVSPVMRVIGTAAWYLGPGRSAMFWVTMRTLWPSLLDGVLSLTVGVVVVLSAGTLSSWLTSRVGEPGED